MLTEKTKVFYRMFGAAALIAVLVLSAVLWQATEEPLYGGGFALTYRGKAWRFSESHKEVNLLYFGYAKCPDVCPLTLSYVGGAFRKLSNDELKKLRFIFVSVDQEQDKPDDVADYATNFFSEFLGLSGSQKQIDDTIRLFPLATWSRKILNHI